jgi:excisionase family DNA binding protein
MNLTVKQAAAELGVSEALVYQLCSSRKLRHERHGLGRGKILIPEEALQEYRQGVTVRAREGAGGWTPPPSAPPLRLKHLKLSGQRPGGGRAAGSGESSSG